MKMLTSINSLSALPCQVELSENLKDRSNLKLSFDHNKMTSIGKLESKHIIEEGPQKRMLTFFLKNVDLSKEEIEFAKQVSITPNKYNLQNSIKFEIMDKQRSAYKCLLDVRFVLQQHFDD